MQSKALSTVCKGLFGSVQTPDLLTVAGTLPMFTSPAPFDQPSMKIKHGTLDFPPFLVELRVLPTVLMGTKLNLDPKQMWSRSVLELLLISSLSFGSRKLIFKKEDVVGQREKSASRT